MSSLIFCHCRGLGNWWLSLLALCFMSVLHLCFCIFMDTWELSCENVSPCAAFFIFMFWVLALFYGHFRQYVLGPVMLVLDCLHGWFLWDVGCIFWALSLLYSDPVQFLGRFPVTMQGRYWPQQLIVILYLKAQQRYHVFYEVQHHLWLLSTLSHACFVFSVLY